MNKSNVFVVENAKQVRKESEKIKVTVNRELACVITEADGSTGVCAEGAGEEGCTGLELPQRAHFQMRCSKSCSRLRSDAAFDCF